jgi:hypothetical protein
MIGQVFRQYHLFWVNLLTKIIRLNHAENTISYHFPNRKQVKTTIARS